MSATSVEKTNPDQYVTLQTYFSHPSFSYLIFSNPTHKTKPGTAIRLVATPLDQSNYVSQSETGN